MGLEVQEGPGRWLVWMDAKWKEAIKVEAARRSIRIGDVIGEAVAAFFAAKEGRSE